MTRRVGGGGVDKNLIKLIIKLVMIHLSFLKFEKLNILLI